ncbi:MAG: Asp-tRNA(Asn)/Glu-tRNA(Gln) amidotransferase subunit GatA [Candidatus Paceibacterota bacterium]
MTKTDQLTIQTAAGKGDDCRSAIADQNTELNAFLEVYENVDRTGSGGALSGVPVALKDNMLVKGEKVSAGSKMLEGYTATYDATAVEKLREAGAELIGRTNMDEFAMGSSTEHSAFGPTKNPRALSRVPGGSSGGSAAAVAAGLVPVALGSDTGGSIRQPASFCGVVGLKPTYGAISRYGLIAMGSSLDQIGPITNTVADAETVFNVLRGRDKKDSTTLSDEVYAQNEERVPAQGGSASGGGVIGVPWNVIDQEGVDKSVAQNMKQSVERLKELGYTIKDIELPKFAYALSVYYILMPAEVSSNLARFDGVKYGLAAEGSDMIDDYLKTRGAGFGSEVKRRIMLGTYVLSSGYHDAYYRKALATRNAIRDELNETFKSVDVIATPTTPTPAFTLGEKSSDPLAMYMADIFTVPANVAGNPALTVPSGVVREGEDELPLGLQLMAPNTQEGRLFAVGKKFLGES